MGSMILASLSYGSTALPAALRSGVVDPATTAVITDSEGEGYLRLEGMSPVEWVALSQ
jgi:hypothetical protein